MVTAWQRTVLLAAVCLDSLVDHDNSYREIYTYWIGGQSLVGFVYGSFDLPKISDTSMMENKWRLGHVVLLLVSMLSSTRADIILVQ
ncbi:hypothetical protein BCR42DRAFT_433170 [Absidia repens]|uniref:Uncharacterized protein n=1 Tax=Absidia repens TaxID=90262 RepID=A0A1X2IWS3_9FUNG|nr:hypothetical protein BCR42DRAFT_433170 [Absidia repens]